LNPFILVNILKTMEKLAEIKRIRKKLYDLIDPDILFQVLEDKKIKKGEYNSLDYGLNQVLENEKIKEKIFHLIDYGLNQICESAFNEKIPFKDIAESFIKNIFPLYAYSDSILEIQKKPLSELRDFWGDVSGNYKFGMLEQHILLTQCQIPYIFLRQLDEKSEDVQKRELSLNFLYPVIQKVNEKDFDYDSLADIILRGNIDTNVLLKDKIIPLSDPFDKYPIIEKSKSLLNFG